MPPLRLTVLAALITASYTPIVGPLYPSVALGQNVPVDDVGGTLRIFNDRMLAAKFYVVPGSGAPTTALADSNLDATTGLPTSAFCTKLAEGSGASDAGAQGQWKILYTTTGNVQRTVALLQDGTITGHTYAGGVGTILITHAHQSGGYLGISFTDGGVTSIKAYDPTTYATWSVGGTPGLFNSQILSTFPAWAYGRYMDMATTNGDFVTSSFGWSIDVVNWGDRRTPTNYYLNRKSGMNAGYPLEWMIALANASNKDAWLCIPEGASDDYITQYATYVANNLGAGQRADFEMGNERWNTQGGFYCYRKAGYAGQTEAIAFQSAATTLWSKPYANGAFIQTFSSDGTTATVVWSGTGHGLSVGTTAYTPLLKGAATGYSNFTATGVATVVDANTITFPTARPSTGGTVAATTVMTANGFLAINGTAGIFTGNAVTDIFGFQSFWHFRRAMQMAKLVKDAFAAVGRQASDCRPVLAIQAGAGDSGQWNFGGKLIVNFLAAQFPGVKMSDRFKAVAVGGYLVLQQNSNGIVNNGFSFAAGNLNTTPQTSSAVLAQLKQMADVGYGAYTYGTTASWVFAQGMELWIYESGLDSVGADNQTLTTRDACTAANADPLMQPLLTEWLQAQVASGATRIGWYTGGAGDYTRFGCFNLGATAAEISASTDPSGQSYKYKGVMGVKTPWATPQPRHVFPCTLSGYDCTGNEAVVKQTGLRPSLAAANLPGSGLYTGLGNNGLSYYVWLEAQAPQTATVTLTGDYTTASSDTINAQPGSPGMGSTGGGSFAISGVKSSTTLGSCTITLQPGVNFVFISAAAHAANVFLDENIGVQFS